METDIGPGIVSLTWIGDESLVAVGKNGSARAWLILFVQSKLLGLAGQPSFQRSQMSTGTALTSKLSLLQM